MNPASDNNSSEPVQEFLTFTLGSEEYAIDILRVQEIRGYDRSPRSPTARRSSRA